MQPDDATIARMIIHCRDIMDEHTIDTRSKLTASYNLVIGLLNLFSIQGEKEWLIEIADDFHKGMIEHIESLYEHDEE